MLGRSLALHGTCMLLISLVLFGCGEDVLQDEGHAIGEPETTAGNDVVGQADEVAEPNAAPTENAAERPVDICRTRTRARQPSCHAARWGRQGGRRRRRGHPR